MPGLQEYLNTKTHVAPTSSGQYATTMFDQYTAPSYSRMYGARDYSPSQTARRRLGNYNVNDAVAFVTNEKPTMNDWGALVAKETTGQDFWGSKTGNSSEGIREIAKNIKQRASALPRNELLSMKGYTPELNNAYGRIASKAFPQRYFQGREGINYIAPPGMSQGVIKWLSKMLPGMSLASVPQTANLYNNIKKMGPQAGYAKWLGLETRDPTKTMY